MQIHDLNTGTPASGHYLAMDSGTDTYKATPGNIKPAYTTGDSSTATSWTSVTAVATGLSFSTLINRITTMMKNVRYLYNILGSSTFSTVASTVTGAIGNTALGTTATTLSGAIAEHESDLGNTDISGIGDGTVTGALSTLNGNTVSTVFASPNTSKYTLNNVRLVRRGNLYILLGEIKCIAPDTTNLNIVTSGMPAVYGGQVFVPAWGASNSSKDALGVQYDTNGIYITYGTAGAFYEISVPMLT